MSIKIILMVIIIFAVVLYIAFSFSKKGFLKHAKTINTAVHENPEIKNEENLSPEVFSSTPENITDVQNIAVKENLAPEVFDNTPENTTQDVQNIAVEENLSPEIFDSTPENTTQDVQNITSEKNFDADLFQAVSSPDTKPQKIQELIKAGANVNAVNEEGKSVLMKCSENISNPDISRVIKTLISRGARINARDKNSMTALMYAAKNGNSKIVKSLLAAGANVNAKIDLSDNENNNDPENKKVLLDVDAGVENGETALMFATMNNDNPEIVKMLIKAEAKINLKTSLGYTALMYAAMNSTNPEIIKTLIKAGATLKAKNCVGDTAFDLAKDDAIKNVLREAVSKK